MIEADTLEDQTKMIEFLDRTSRDAIWVLDQLEAIQNNWSPSRFTAAMLFAVCAVEAASVIEKTSKGIERELELDRSSDRLSGAIRDAITIMAAKVENE